VPLAVDTSHHAGQSSGRDRLLSSGSFCRPASGMKGRRTKLQITRRFCKPICKPDAARHFETGEAEPDEARRDLSCPPRSPRPRETVRDGGDAHRTAHNPSDDRANAFLRQYGQKNRPATHYEWRAACLRTRYLHR
jgi:hypothetical protein